MQARDAGLRSISRDVFLDNDRNATSIRLQYDIWQERARESGSAVAIGHPYPSTLEVLRERLPASGVEFRFLTVSELIDEREQRESSIAARDTTEQSIPED